MKGLFSILFFSVALILGFAAQAQDKDAYNCDDPKCQQEQARLSNPATMNAQFLSRGIPCETGACFQNADKGMGFDTTPLINVDTATGSQQPRVSPSDIVQ